MSSEGIGGQLQRTDTPGLKNNLKNIHPQGKQVALAQNPYLNHYQYEIVAFSKLAASLEL